MAADSDIARAAEAVASGQGGRNPAVHLLSLSMTKVADGLIQPKLVLTWLLTALGAPGYLIGALVPVREAGALLPQVALAGRIQASDRRRVYWSLGAFFQGVAAFAIAVAVLTLEGAAAGWAVLAALGCLAVARSACSVSYKDVLARTVETGLRGRLTGAAATISAALVFAYAALLGLGVIPREPGVLAVAIAGAGLLWLVASMLFLTLDEPRRPDGAPDEMSGLSLSEMVAPLREDREFRHYIAVRALFISTALAPTFLVMLTGQGDGDTLGNLGTMMVAASLAAILSGFVWGWLSDRSSRKVLILAGSISAVALAAAAGWALVQDGPIGSVAAAGVIFVAQLGYEGVRAGRKLHLTDMDTGDRKVAYTAVSNTMIGVLLMAGGLFGLAADLIGPALVLAMLAGLSALGAVAAVTLSEVQRVADG